MGLTDKHLVYGDDVPQTQTEKDYYWQIKHLEEQNAKLKEAVRKIKDEIKNEEVRDDEGVLRSQVTYTWKVLQIIDKHLKGGRE